MAAVTLNPPATLEQRDDDVRVAFDRPLSFSLFKGTDVKSYVEKNPGTLAVRRFQAGDEVCRLGEMGWTAFYVLTADEAIELLQEVEKDAPETEKERLAGEIAELQGRQ